MSAGSENKAWLDGFLGSQRPILGTTIAEDMAYKQGAAMRARVNTYVPFTFDETVPLWLQLLVFIVAVLAGTALYFWLRARAVGVASSLFFSALAGLGAGGIARLFVQALKPILLIVAAVSVYYLVKRWLG